MPKKAPHTSLTRLGAPSRVWTAGRLLKRHGIWHLCNATIKVPLHCENGLLHDLSERDLARVHAQWTGERLEVIELQCHPVQDTSEPEAMDHTSSRVMHRRAACVAKVRRFFETRDFLEVCTPGLVAEPGTDVYLEPFNAPFVPDDQVEQTSPTSMPAYLHTSPEFLMKRLLGKGFERIWQMTPAWRNGEVTDLHTPEFTCVEWYRAWEDLGAIIEDTEHLIIRLIGDHATYYDMEGRHQVDLRDGFTRVTMQELVQQACGFDILATQSADALQDAISSRGLLRKRGQGTHPMFGVESLGDDAHIAGEDERWMELFFELQITHLDPHLARMGAVCLTHWPTQLAVLAARNAEDSRVADRFETYIGGVECSNGFRELTDADEQRARFIEDLAQRARLGRPSYPMPERFLRAMARGMPPSAGVALGFDRVVMLATGARTISEVLPFSMRRGMHGGPPEFT